MPRLDIVDYLTKVARDATASKTGVGKTPRRIVTIAAIQIVRLVFNEGIVTVTVSSSGSVKNIITITRM
jgi:hypothetical protein